MNVCFETFGCRLNRAEALEDEARMTAAGNRVVKSHADADLIVIRGCSVTSHAQRDCEHLIKHLKHKYPCKQIKVIGCLESAKGIRTIGGSDDSFVVPTRSARAYLKVQDGCDARCSFCIVPQFRGKSVSLPFDDLVDRAKRFVDAGYHEIVVTGCNLCQYQSDGRHLDDLVSSLAAVSPECRIRLGSLEPGPVAEAVVQRMAELPNVCRFVHLSVQTAVDRLLKLMYRPYTVDQVSTLAEQARRLMPMVALGCDMIVGFPGEREADLIESEKFLRRHEFSKVHVFPFSERPGTAASGFPGRVEKSVRRERARKLTDVAKSLRKAFRRSFIGKTVEVVIESDERVAGWTGEYLWVDAGKAGSVRNSLRKQLRTFRVTALGDHGLKAVEVLNGR